MAKVRYVEEIAKEVWVKINSFIHYAKKQLFLTALLSTESVAIRSFLLRPFNK